MLLLRGRSAVALCASSVLLHFPSAALAQAGPPFFANDPGTPGHANWEVNIGSMPTVARGASSYQIPQIDLNVGIGDRVQLTYEIPYVVQIRSGESAHSAWSNGNSGVKVRFVDQGADGWQVSTFPQIEMGASQRARQTGIAGPAPRYLIPIEASRRIGTVDLNVEAGYYFGSHGPRERILGFVAGRSVTERLEVGVETYDDRVDGGVAHSTTLELGGRYKLRPGVIALFMAGPGVNRTSQGQTQFVGYCGVQFLLSNWGRTITSTH